MAQQKQGSKPNFKSDKKAKGTKKAKLDNSVKKKAKKKQIPAQPTSLFARGYCESLCGHCISCQIAKADEENQRRISGSFRSRDHGNYSYSPWSRY